MVKLLSAACLQDARRTLLDLLVRRRPTQADAPTPVLGVCLTVLPSLPKDYHRLFKAAALLEAPATVDWKR